MQDFHHVLMVIVTRRKTEFIYLTTEQTITKWMVEYMMRTILLEIEYLRL